MAPSAFKLPILNSNLVNQLLEMLPVLLQNGTVIELACSNYKACSLSTSKVLVNYVYNPQLRNEMSLRTITGVFNINKK